jgi:hypothetical protein
MALWVCAGEAGCGTKYAVGLFRCPRCHNTEFFEDGDPMAKISRLGGASVASPETTGTVPEAPAEVAPVAQPEPADAVEPVAAEPAPEPEPVAEASLLVSSEAPEPTPEPAPGPDYEAWTVEQLKEQLAARGLPKSGKRDDLVLRLLEDDDTRTAGPGTE